jgi:hypothetical protein
MNKLEHMQATFQEWLKAQKQAGVRDQSEIYALIEQKLIELAEKNGYTLLDRNALLGDDNVFLVFGDLKRDKFISAWANEEGFDTEELDDLW